MDLPSNPFSLFHLSLFLSLSLSLSLSLCFSLKILDLLMRVSYAKISVTGWRVSWLRIDGHAIHINWYDITYARQMMKRLIWLVDLSQPNVVLHNGRFYNGRRWRVASCFASKKGDLHRHRVLNLFPHRSVMRYWGTAIKHNRNSYEYELLPNRPIANWSNREVCTCSSCSTYTLAVIWSCSGSSSSSV